MKTKFSKKFGIFQIRENKVFSTWRPPFYQRSYRVGGENELVGGFKKKLETQKLGKSHFWGPPQMLFHLYKLGIQND